MPKSLIIRQLNEISYSKVSSSSLLRLSLKVGTICVCGWSANLESKLLAVFCSLSRLLLATLLFEISFIWRKIRDFGNT